MHFEIKSFQNYENEILTIITKTKIAHKIYVHQKLKQNKSSFYSISS